MALSARFSAPAALRASRVAAAKPRASVRVSASAGKDYMLTLPGISEPTGFFDPAGFTDSPAFTVSEAKRFRESELTHGRVAMLAALGWVVAEEFHVRARCAVPAPAGGAAGRRADLPRAS